MLHPNELYTLARWRQDELIASARIETVGPARYPRLPGRLGRLLAALLSAQPFPRRRSARSA